MKKKVVKKRKTSTRKSGKVSRSKSGKPKHSKIKKMIKISKSGKKMTKKKR